MIDYELAKKLKDAGFPQNFKNGAYYAEGDLTFKEAQIAHTSFPKTFFEERRKGTPESDLADAKCISIPTLSELIEACEENIASLHFLHDMNMVTAHSQTSLGIVSRAVTAEEAVAQLWLSLQEKK